MRASTILDHISFSKPMAGFGSLFAMAAAISAVVGNFLTTELDEPLLTEDGDNLLWEA